MTSQFQKTLEQRPHSFRQSFKAIGKIRKAPSIVSGAGDYSHYELQEETQVQGWNIQ